MKGISLISGVIFLAFTITAIVVVYEAGTPIIQRLQTSATVDKMKSTFADLDKLIQQVAAEGKGSKRTAYLRIDAGTLTVNETKNTIEWEVDTPALIVSPRTYQQFGNVIIGSNLETTTNKTVTYNGEPAFLLENEHLRVYINRTGSASSYTTYNTSTLLLAIYNKGTQGWLDYPNILEITLDNNANSGYGSGYTSLQKEGKNLPYGRVTAYLESLYGVNYYINFILESGTDFLEITVNT